MAHLRQPIGIALLIFLVNLVLRLITADSSFMFGDEPFTIYFAQWPVADIYKIVSTTNNPPTFEILLHGWMKITGVNPFWLRALPALLISLTTIPIALIAHRIGGKYLMFSSALLFLLTNFEMDMAHNVRAYSLLICSSVWSMFFFFRLVEKPSLKRSIPWIITSFFCIAAHYFAWFIILVQWVSLLAFSQKRARLLAYFSRSTAVLVILYLPLLATLVKRYFATLDEGTFLRPVVNLNPLIDLGMYSFNNSKWLVLVAGIIISATVIHLLIKQKHSAIFRSALIVLFGLAILPLAIFLLPISFLTDSVITSAGWAMASMLFFCFLLVGILYRSEASLEKKSVVLWLTLPIIIVWFMSQRVPMFLDRYLAHILTALVIIIPLLLLRWNNYLRYSLLGVVVLLYAFSFRFSIQESTSEVAVNSLKEMKKTNTVVLVSPGYEDFQFAYFYDKNLYTNVSEHRLDTLGEKIIREEGYAKYKEGFRRALRRENIYVLNFADMLDIRLDTVQDLIHYEFNTFISYPDNRIKETLEESFGPAMEVKSFPGGRFLYHYNRQ